MLRSQIGLNGKDSSDVKAVGTGTGNELGRKIFIHPGNSSMRQVSYGRIR